MSSRLSLSCRLFFFHYEVTQTARVYKHAVTNENSLDLNPFNRKLALSRSFLIKFSSLSTPHHHTFFNSKCYFKCRICDWKILNIQWGFYKGCYSWYWREKCDWKQNPDGVSVASYGIGARYAIESFWRSFGDAASAASHDIGVSNAIENFEQFFELRESEKTLRKIIRRLLLAIWQQTRSAAWPMTTLILRCWHAVGRNIILTLSRQCTSMF